MGYLKFTQRSRRPITGGVGDLVYPILERAPHHGVVVAIHKTIPLGPVPMEPFRVDDLDAAFIAYPDLPIAIGHGGFASSRTRR